MKEYIEERAIQIANYIIDENATVRQTAKRFGISKSTVHTVVLKWKAKNWFRQGKKSFLGKFHGNSMEQG